MLRKKRPNYKFGLTGDTPCTLRLSPFAVYHVPCTFFDAVALNEKQIILQSDIIIDEKEFLEWKNSLVTKCRNIVNSIPVITEMSILEKVQNYLYNRQTSD